MHRANVSVEMVYPAAKKAANNSGERLAVVASDAIYGVVKFRGDADRQRTTFRFRIDLWVQQKGPRVRALWAFRALEGLARNCRGLIILHRASGTQPQKRQIGDTRGRMPTIEIALHWADGGITKTYVEPDSVMNIRHARADGIEHEFERTEKKDDQDREIYTEVVSAV